MAKFNAVLVQLLLKLHIIYLRKRNFTFYVNFSLPLFFIIFHNDYSLILFQVYSYFVR